MKRTAINPTDWAKDFLNQGEVIEGATRTLHMSGQIAVQPDADSPFGVVPFAPGDMRAQMARALQNIDEILAEAGMNRDDLVHMRFFVTDMEAALGTLDVMMGWLEHRRPPQSLIGVKELVMPEVMIEIEATAATGG